MPRASLPNSFKDMRTMKVTLTQTTEEEIWEHMCDWVERYKEDMKRRIHEIDDILYQFDKENPYLKRDWMRYFTAHWMSVEEREGWNRKYKNGRIPKPESEWDVDRDLCYVPRDLKLCLREFKWDEDPEKSNLVNDWEYRMDALRDYYKLNTETLDYTDERLYNKAKDTFYNENKELILHKRENHGTVSLLEKDEVPECKYCREYYLREKPEWDRRQKELEEEEERRQKEEEQRIQKEKEQRQREAEERRNRPAVIHTCELCDYKTVHGYNYELHMESKEHKQKQRDKDTYCEKCNHQSRSRAEHLAHLTSKKHLGSSEDKQTFYCEHCKFTTPFKSLWDTHCNTRKHKVASGEVQEIDVPTLFRCEPCEYQTYSKQCYEKHCESKRHKAKFG